MTGNPIIKQCSIEGCDRSVHGRGFCSKHYNRWHRWGDPQMVMPRGRPMGRKYDGVACSVNGCERQATSRGWCYRHYANWLRTENPLGLQAEKPSSKNRRIARRLKAIGMTYVDIGEIMGVSRQRIQQLVSPDENDKKAYIKQYGEVCYFEPSHNGTLNFHHVDYRDQTIVLICTPCHKKIDSMMRMK